MRILSPLLKKVALTRPNDRRHQLAVVLFWEHLDETADLGAPKRRVFGLPACDRWVSFPAVAVSLR